MSSRRRAIFPVAGASYEGRASVPLRGDGRIAAQSDAEWAASGDNDSRGGRENWRRDRPDHQAWITPGATAPLLTYGSLGILAVAESIVRCSLEGAARNGPSGCAGRARDDAAAGVRGRTAAAVASRRRASVGDAVRCADHRGARRTGRGAVRAGPRRPPAPRAHPIAVCLSAPFLVLALDASGPSARRPGCSRYSSPRWRRGRRSRGLRSGRGPPHRRMTRPARRSPGTCSSTRPAASGRGSRASCTTSSPTTFR